jgi:2-desacetyl-2-hydroxyethyl bacteriochlorophyllide A dehydrogenase
MRALITRLLPDRRREKVLVSDWPEPKGPAGNQVKTQTLYSGVTNGTERNDLLGGYYAHKDEELPRGWGYQNVGRVVETGPDVKELKVGDVLYMSADHAEYVVMPEDGLLIKLPPEVDQKHAALFGMSSVAMRTCRHADLRMGEKVFIVGLGFIGQIAAQIASVMGAKATVCDLDPKRLDLARKMGAAEEVFDVSGEGWAKYIEEGKFDAVIDFAGVPDMEDRLIGAVRRRGRVLLVAGRFKVSYTFNNGQGREVTIKQNSHFDRDDLTNLCRLVDRGMVKIGPLVRDVVSVNEAGRIYNTLRDRPSELLGTVFVW